MLSIFTKCGTVAVCIVSSFAHLFFLKELAMREKSKGEATFLMTVDFQIYEQEVLRH